MRGLIAVTSLSLFLGTLGGCSQSGVREAEGSRSPRLYVPTASIAQTPQGAPAINAYAILPASDSFNLWVPRAEKGTDGPLILQEASSYSVFTYDQQLISNLWGPSYRYRWIVQQGVTLP